MIFCVCCRFFGVQQSASTTPSSQPPSSRSVIDSMLQQAQKTVSEKAEDCSTEGMDKREHLCATADEGGMPRSSASQALSKFAKVCASMARTVLPKSSLPSGRVSSKGGQQSIIHKLSKRLMDSKDIECVDEPHAKVARLTEPESPLASLDNLPDLPVLGQQVEQRHCVKGENKAPWPWTPPAFRSSSVFSAKVSICLSPSLTSLQSVAQICSTLFVSQSVFVAT